MSLFPPLEAPDARLAVSCGGRDLSYLDLAADCERYRERMTATARRPGDRVLVETRPTLDTVVALVGNALAGLVSVPLNPKLGPRERDHIERDSRRGELPEDAALILYTSGTTGAPKGVVLTWSNVTSNLDALIETWQWSSEDVLTHALPLFHVHGLVLGLFGTLRAGSSLRWAVPFSPDGLARALDGEATMLFAVPTMYHRLLDAAASDATVTRVLQRLRLRVSGSAALPAPTHQRLIELGCPVYERYGLTETLINCAVPASGAAQPGRVGPPLPGVELRLVDDTRRPIDARDDETVGEVAVRGPSVFHGYLGLPEATDEVRDADGWLYTGDLATVDANGSVRIHGRRATDLIKTGGFRVGAGEIEACLLERPEVREVAVIGLPDSDLGERIVAYVVGEGDPAVLCDHVAARLTPHKRPREVRFVSALPRNAMGKIEKRRLRDAGA